MGRSYFVEETVGQYLSELTTKSKPLITGLLIGQCSPQRDYVILAVQTPPKDEESKSNAGVSAELSNIDEEWITAHANQVSRMLPGGLSVLGVFTVAIPELSKEIQNTLRKLVFSVEKSVARKRLWSISEEDVSDRVVLHFCSATKKTLCRTYDIQDPKSTAKPADWKYQSGLSTSWIPLECTTNANIHIPLLATSSSHELEKNIRNGLTRWAKQIEEAVILINGQVKEEDADLVDGQKKSGRGSTQSATQSLDARILTQLSLKSNSRSTATVQICTGSINLKGALKCKAFIHHNKPKVKDAIKALKRDIINTLSDRCEILFEDLLMNETTGMKSLEREYHALPCRVFAPIAGSRVLVCDYKFGDETIREVQEHFLEMLDQAVQAEDLHAVEEMSTVEIIPPKEFPDEIQHKQLTKETLLLKLHQNIGVVIAVAVAISAAAFSFNYFSD
ncbi:protein odr-4 homolog [Sphaerodactylus townsendi]|uniref:protein odr-4 homolog n=1 Tax=Sphaerodactylus townsendi TaxID=933632 RepID=UPI002026331C|nr:protein odr-4 homolog [Sphaerodactylus townsendi]XP_048338455.1 protein odr-4 homolog [Sphaerodactylus townsendi]XP_048338457.1 protein odr-4 homolog [Sphaerodactylus townsendi]